MASKNSSGNTSFSDSASTDTAKLSADLQELPMRQAYAGIGARKTPGLVLQDMQRIAGRLAKEDWTLWSGGAAGAD